jgi:NAD(P)-dependent dehydrogenase (short-subunit alcohol dehydrogenase family)
MPNCFDLTGRVAVVIGATSGIGRTIAVGLAEHGADVIPSGRRQEQLDEICREIEALGRGTLVHAADATDRQAIDRLRDAVLKRFGRVDILVNAAGHTLKKPTISICEQEWASILNTNLTGALLACQSFYQPLKSSGRGRVINIASLSSFLAFPEVAAYSASQTALLSLTRSLACEWAPDGISVNAIAPGVFPTDLNRELIHGTPRGKEMLMRTPMARFGKPEELIGAAVLLASDGASFLTGQCIAVDGGYLASGVNS